MQKKSKSKKNSKKNEESKKEEKSDKKLKTCTHVKARHILCAKLSKIEEAYNKLLDNYGEKPPSTEFAKIATEYSECSTSKKGGDLGLFPRGKMVGTFQDIAFSTPEGKMSQIFKSEFGYHFMLLEQRKNA